MIEIKTTEQFEEIIKDNKNVIIDFWSDWCSPCKAMLPIFSELNDEFKDVIFAKVQVNDETRPILSKLKIMSLPTLIFFKDGYINEGVSGFHDKDGIIELIKRNL